jgi:hypothetical protein
MEKCRYCGYLLAPKKKGKYGIILSPEQGGIYRYPPCVDNPKTDWWWGAYCGDCAPSEFDGNCKCHSAIDRRGKPMYYCKNE